MEKNPQPTLEEKEVSTVSLLEAFVALSAVVFFITAFSGFFISVRKFVIECSSGGVIGLETYLHLLSFIAFISFAFSAVLLLIIEQQRKKSLSD